MSIKITIQKLKNIDSLVFTTPETGAYLLTGTNGSGKTSLLTCLSRLRNPNAFQKGFRSSSHASLDSHRGSSIKYEINGQSVTYTYVKERWSPLPRKNSSLLSYCGYPAVTYIAADATRVQPQEQSFTPRRVRPVKDPIKNTMNSVFSTGKFSELCYINVNPGGAEKAYLIRQPGQGNKPATYYSERNFSLGELCVLKLLLELDDIQKGSLVLIDELELATHPRAQAHLFEHLKSISQEKNLTIIFSTHSVSLIKNTDRRNILFLENRKGHVTCSKGCYPTYILGHLSSGEEVAPDSVIYVEDDSGQKCVDAMIDLYRQEIKKSIIQPTTLVVPLGGFRQILDFLDRAPQMLPPNTRLMAALDKDVQEESLSGYRDNNDHNMLALFSRIDKKIKYLPWTPEVGLVELIRSDIHRHESQLKDHFNDNRLYIATNWGNGAAGLSKKPLRDACKKATNELSEKIKTMLGINNDKARAELFRYLIIQTHKQETHDLLSLVGSLIHH